jgi:hypothetical protein
LNEPFYVGSQVPNRAAEPDIPRSSAAEAPGAKRGHRQAESARNFLFGHGWSLLLIHTIVLGGLGTRIGSARGCVAAPRPACLQNQSVVGQVRERICRAIA